MANAWLNLRYTVEDRQLAFESGLKALGYTVRRGVTLNPSDGDVLVTWNRIGLGQNAALAFERAGRPVLVAENASWGNEFAGQRWYTIARNWHNTSGMFPIGSADRWAGLGVELEPWRKDGETVILPQRGIGAGSMPRGWGGQFKGRVRPHPGRNQNMKPLRDDLADAGKVITWGSGAAVQALMWGIKVESHMPDWIGEQDSTDAGRQAMFERMAWCQWTLDEIAEGLPFERLLCES